MHDTVQPEAEPHGPLLVRQPPPTTTRLSQRAIVGAAATLLIPLAFAMTYKLQQRHATQQTVHPPPLPRHDQIAASTKPQLFQIPTTHAGLDLTPKPPPLPPAPDPMPFTQPPLPPPAPRPLPPPPRAQRETPPPVKPPPNKWLFAHMEGGAVGASPFSRSAEGPRSAFADPAVQAAAVNDMAKSPAVKAAIAQLIHPATWEKPADPTRVLYRSQTIPGLLLGAINSDIPGQIKILVTRDVTDKLGQGHVLIPQQAIVLGHQSGKAVYGQNRIQVDLEEMEFPDGTVLSFAKGGLADRSGAMGTAGHVQNHIGSLLAAAGVSAVLSVGIRSPFGNTQGFQATMPQQLTDAAGQSVSQSGQAIVQRELQRAPTITVPAGVEVTLSLLENLSLAHPPTPTQ